MVSDQICRRYWRWPGCHGKFSKMRRLLENDVQPLSSKTYRIWNEVPTILMIIIVVSGGFKAVSSAKVLAICVKQSLYAEV
jgi:hypothetical protein